MSWVELECWQEWCAENHPSLDDALDAVLAIERPDAIHLYCQVVYDRSLNGVVDPFFDMLVQVCQEIMGDDEFDSLNISETNAMLEQAELSKDAILGGDA